MSKAAPFHQRQFLKSSLYSQQPGAGTRAQQPLESPLEADRHNKMENLQQGKVKQLHL